MIINGKKREVPEGANILEMLKVLELDSEKVVVEVNAAIVGKDDFEDHKLSTGDKIEIIAFVGGG